jgi:CheY-like chemotaxis protein
MVSAYKNPRTDVTQIMIVEDNNLHFEHLTRRIKGSYPDIIIDRAENEHEAIELLENNINQTDRYHYDCIVTDIIFALDNELDSDFGGIRLLEYIKQNNIDYIKDKVIVITAHEGMMYREKFGQKEDTTIVEKVKELGAYDCISKNLIGKNYLDEVTNRISCFSRHPDPSDQLSKINTDSNTSVIFNKKKDFNPATRKIQNFLKELEETTLALIEAIEERVIEIPSSNMGTTEQHTRIEFPAECIVKTPTKLVIQIPQQSHSVESELEPAILYIQLTAENFSAEQKRQRLIVPVNEKSEEIIFELTPTEVGEQMVEIEFFHKCSRVGYAIAKTNVKSQAT